MKQIKKSEFPENLGVEEYIARRREYIREEIKKDQENYPEPFKFYSSFLLLSL